LPPGEKKEFWEAWKKNPRGEYTRGGEEPSAGIKRRSRRGTALETQNEK